MSARPGTSRLSRSARYLARTTSGSYPGMPQTYYLNLTTTSANPPVAAAPAGSSLSSQPRNGGPRPRVLAIVHPWEHELAGRIDHHVISSAVLVGNPLGDPADRPLWV